MIGTCLRQRTAQQLPVVLCSLQPLRLSLIIIKGKETEHAGKLNILLINF